MSNVDSGKSIGGFKRASVKLPAQVPFGKDPLQATPDNSTTTSNNNTTNSTTPTNGSPTTQSRKVTFGSSRLTKPTEDNNNTTPTQPTVSPDEIENLDPVPVTRPRTTRAKTMVSSQMILGGGGRGGRGLGPPRLKMGARVAPTNGEDGNLVDIDGTGDDLQKVSLEDTNQDKYKPMKWVMSSEGQKKGGSSENLSKKKDDDDDDDDDEADAPKSTQSWASIMSKTKSNKNTGMGSGRFVIGTNQQLLQTLATNNNNEDPTTDAQPVNDDNLDPSQRRGTFKKAILIGQHNNNNGGIADDEPGSTQRISSLDLAGVQRPKQQYHTIDPASIPQWKKSNEEVIRESQQQQLLQQHHNQQQQPQQHQGGTFTNITNTFSTLLKSSPNKSQSSSSSGGTKSRAELEYNEYLDQARKSTFQDIAQLNFVYQAGKDNLGRTVIVVVASHLPAKQVDMERVLLYTISVMDPVVEGDYVLVYAHTNMSNENKPSFAWLKKVYTIFNRKYKKNLKGLYIVHPTTWIKFTLRLFKPFLSSKFWRKLVYIDDLVDLFKFFSKEQLNLPSHVMMHKPAGRKAQPIFGAPLEEVVNRPDNPGEIPALFEKGLIYLEKKALLVEGIFRLSGANSQIKSLKNCYDSGEEVDLNDCEDVHTVAGLLKLYLRELPEPLFPFETYSSFIEIAKGDAPKQQKIDSLKLLISLLPAANRALTKHLLRFLDKVLQNCQVNKMTAVNLSIVFAPNLLKDKDNNVMNVVADAQYVNLVVQLLLENVNQII